MIPQSFWQLINEQGVEIPPIQRDYAQGRQTGRVPVIRQKFISAIFGALEDSKPLSLDFVYGKIFGMKNEAEQRRNRHAIEALISGIRDYANTLDLSVSNLQVEEKLHIPGTATYLIPLDGQQRLTTLFLVHWYILSRLARHEDLNVLRRFRYKTRKSSEDFINLLCNTASLDFSTSNLLEEICELESFSNTWLDDPTVNSLLNAIQDIHAYCAGKGFDRTSFEELWKNLGVAQTVHFDFLNLQDFNLSDELYVKMNARGKQLSDFENFKAWLFGKIEQNGWYPAEHWNSASTKFEIEWNDLFWDNKDENVFEVDHAYFQYFKLQFLADLVLEAEMKESGFAAGPRQQLIESIVVSKENFDFESAFDEKFGRRLPTYFRVLDICSKQLAHSDDDPRLASFSKFFFNHKGSVQWIELLRHYIIAAYLELNGEKGLQSEHFNQYYRVVSNLFNNQTFDSAALYKGALTSIRAINKAIQDSDIFAWLRELDPKANRYIFTREQLAEEKIKGALITEDSSDGTAQPSWLKLLVEAEHHSYFSGKIMFLLKLSDLDKEKFQSYYQEISPLFTNEILSHHEYLFQRALLTCGNYFVDRGVDKVSFCRNEHGSYRVRNENWLQVLGSETKLAFIRALVDSPNYNPDEIEASLRAIIQAWTTDHPVEHFIMQPLEALDYRELYISSDGLFKYGSEKLIKLYNQRRYAYQLNATTTGGYFWDTILEFVKFQFYATDSRVVALPEQGWDNDPYLEIDGRINIITKADTHRFVVTNAGSTHLPMTTIQQLLDFIGKQLVDHD